MATLQAYLEKVTGGPAGSNLLLDFGQGEFIDSEGIACLIDAWRRVENGSGKFAVFGLNDQVRRTFELSGLGERVCVAAHLAGALAHLRSASRPMPPA